MALETTKKLQSQFNSEIIQEAIAIANCDTHRIMQQQRILSIGGLVAILMVLIAAVDVDGASSRRRRPLGTKENVKTQDELYPK